MNDEKQRAAGAMLQASPAIPTATAVGGTNSLTAGVGGSARSAMAGDTPNANTDLIQSLGRVYRAYMTAFEKHVGVPMPRWRIMLALQDWTSPKPQRALVAALHMDPGALTRQVQQLESQGWIRREIDVSDNRLTNVELTKAGRDLIAEALPRRDLFLRDFPPTERLEQAQESLAQWESKLTRVGEDASA